MELGASGSEKRVLTTVLHCPKCPVRLTHVVEDEVLIFGSSVFPHSTVRRGKDGQFPLQVVRGHWTFQQQLLELKQNWTCYRSFYGSAGVGTVAELSKA